jgi:hypothetical protein
LASAGLRGQVFDGGAVAVEIQQAVGVLDAAGNAGQETEAF